VSSWRWFQAVVAIAVGAGAAWLMLDRLAPNPGEPTRLTELESKVRALEVRAQVVRLWSHARLPHAAGTAQPFAVDCPASWQQLGPVGQALWGCRTPTPLHQGFYPNCNVTTSSLAKRMSAADYYHAVLRESPVLSTVTPVSERAIVSHGHPGYEVSFEHDGTGRRLRALASLFLAEQQLFVITCSAPPEVFDGFVGDFRAIAGSFRLES
jgi:hypothetical protein